MSNDVENSDADAQKSSAYPFPSPSLSTETQATWYSGLLEQVSVYGIAAGYCLSASLLSIINKWAVMKFPYPGALTALQYFTSAAGVLIFGQLKILEHDKLDLVTMWRFLPAAVIFYLSLFTNSELLLHANVDTFIVFRSAVPIFVAIGETLYLHQPWPSMKTWFSLATIFSGSVLYVTTDYQFTLMAYSWALAYLISMSIDFVYIKHVVITIGLNTWGLVLYNNLKHSTFVGTVGLLICMAGGVMYQQFSSSKPKAANKLHAQVSEEQQKLLEMQSSTSSGNEKQVTGSEQGK